MYTDSDDSTRRQRPALGGQANSRCCTVPGRDVEPRTRRPSLARAVGGADSPMMRLVRPAAAVTGHDLLALRLDMGDLDAIARGASGRRRRHPPLVRRARPLAVRPVVPIDRTSPAWHAAFPDHDPESLSDMAGRSLARRHVVGLLDRQDLLAASGWSLWTTPAVSTPPTPTPTPSSTTSTALSRGATTGSRVVLEWTRHQWLSWGEDEDLFFFVEELRGPSRLSRRPLERQGGRGPRADRQDPQPQPQSRPPSSSGTATAHALHELFDAWRMPEYFHADLAMSLDNAARQLAHQGLLAELTDTLDEVVSSVTRRRLRAARLR